MNKHDIKDKLYKACEVDIEKRIQSIQEVLRSVEESRNNETKSSAGDKYETGRSIMQMEEEKNRNQLFQTNQVRLALKKIDPQKKSDKVESGSLVETTSGNYFISTGIGKVKIEDQLYYCVSSNSPIGRRMMNKVRGEEVEFNGIKLVIREIY